MSDKLNTSIVPPLVLSALCFAGGGTGLVLIAIGAHARARVVIGATAAIALALAVWMLWKMAQEWRSLGR